MFGIVPASDSNVKDAGKLLREGGLVAFPTETVYGLGACALSELAVHTIFAAKGRPFNDPLIVHVPNATAIAPLVSLSSRLSTLVDTLTSAFWPGPLTLILPASSRVPRIVTAGGDTVGVRVPAHPVALALLREAGVPVAAPSANRFGHVSPTRAHHVASDLDCTAHRITVLDGGACSVGIESTILRLEGNTATILRRGSVTLHEIRSVLAAFFDPERITAPARTVASEDHAQSAPGQLLTHYAPDVPAFLVLEGTRVSATHLASACVLDVGGRLRALREGALHYRNLSDGSKGGLDSDALKYAFEGLREAEAVSGAQRIFLPNLSAEAGTESERLLALGDRFFRSASGRSWE